MLRATTLFMFTGLTLALDTSAYEHAAFHFDGGVLQALQRACRQGRLRLVVVDLTVIEVEHRIRERVRDAVATVKRAYVLKSVGLPAFNALLDHEALRLAEATLIARWNRYLEECRATIIRANEVDPLEVFRDFFARRAPFSRSKPAEFRDAFVLATLLDFSEVQLHPVRVCSTDDDFKSFCTGKNLVFHDSVGKALEEALSEERVMEDVFMQIALRFEEFQAAVLAQFSALSASVSETPDAVVETLVPTTVYKNVNLAVIDVADDTIEVEGDVSVQFTADVRSPELSADSGGTYGPFCFVRYTGRRVVEFSSRVGPLASGCPIISLQIIDPQVLKLSADAGDHVRIVDPIADDED